MQSTSFFILALNQSVFDWLDHNRHDQCTGMHNKFCRTLDVVLQRLTSRNGVAPFQGINHRGMVTGLYSLNHAFIAGAQVKIEDGPDS